jgi:hypothetical protein
MYLEDRDGVVPAVVAAVAEEAVGGAEDVTLLPKPS